MPVGQINSCVDYYYGFIDVFGSFHGICLFHFLSFRLIRFYFNLGLGSAVLTLTVNDMICYKLVERQRNENQCKVTVIQYFVGTY